MDTINNFPYDTIIKINLIKGIRKYILPLHPRFIYIYQVLD